MPRQCRTGLTSITCSGSRAALPAVIAVVAVVTVPAMAHAHDPSHGSDCDPDLGETVVHVEAPDHEDAPGTPDHDH